MEIPAFLARPTVVGSFPHTDPQPLLEKIFRVLPDLPAWPQLPVRDWRESMYIQYSEGFPGVWLDEKSQKISFVTNDTFYSQLEGFYEAVIEKNVEPFAISRKYALGLHQYREDLLSRNSGGPTWVKGQLTGPFSFSMTLTDNNKRSIAYNPELYEVAVQGIALKARWMARELRKISPGVLVMLDEPYLCSFGSAFVNVSQDDVMQSFRDAVTAIHEEKALAGLHCCGNTDWSLALECGIDVLNLDAFEFFQGLTLYPDQLKAFLERGGNISWGIVPANEKAQELGAEKLLQELDDRVHQLVSKGLDRDQLYRQSLITPSCGMGTQTVETADRVLDLVVELSDLVRKREGFA